MGAYQVFAIIANSVVENIIPYRFDEGGYTLATVYAVSNYGESAFAVDATYYPVGVGDTYYGGRFYRNGVEIHKMPTEQEEIDSLNNAVDDLVVAVLGG